MKRFKKVYIETTNICNLVCDFCPKTTRKQEVMPLSRFKAIIEKVSPFTDHVYFHLMGEPLLNPELEGFLKVCEESGLYVNLTTNGTLIDRAKPILLSSKALRQVNLSLSSYEANPIEMPLEAYIGKVSDFVRACEATNIICSIRLWNMDTETLKGANAYNAHILDLLERSLFLEQGTLAEILSKKNSAKLKDRVYLNMAEKFEWPDLSRIDPSEDVFCYGLRDQIGILVDGTVVPCCLDSEGNLALGNVLEQELEDILLSERAVAIYEGFSRRRAVEELCQKCGYAHAD